MLLFQRFYGYIFFENLIHFLIGELCEYQMFKIECNSNGFILKKKKITHINEFYIYDIPKKTLNIISTLVESLEKISNICLCYPGFTGDSCQTFEKPSDYRSIFNFIKKTLLWSDDISGKVCEFGFTGDLCKYNGLSSSCNLHGFFNEVERFFKKLL